MYAIDALILVGATLLMVAILSNTLSSPIGVPGLVIFMAVGMLAGEDGVGRIAFDGYPIAHAVGTLALVLILFDGGLQTPWKSFRIAWRPAVTLATVGVIVTAGVTGLAASWILGIPLVVGLLLGSIVGSTDAAAVFSVLRGRGLALRPRVASTLEIESGSNDPMAVLLTLGCLGVLTGTMGTGWEMGGFLVQQAVIGALGGAGIGWVGAWAINRVDLQASGLYPAFTLALAFLAYGIPAAMGGSGFLAVYLAGLVLGNANIVFKRGVFMAHDGGAWLAQISMFVMLGLLAQPTELMGVALEGLLVALVLVFVARPLAVALSVLPFGFSARESGFMAWAGLKGAIPIILAIYPLLLGIEEGGLIFNVVFFVVLLSALTQGWTLPIVAGWFGVREPNRGGPPVTLEISSLKHVDGDIVEYLVEGDSWVAGHLVRDLALPDTAVIAMIARGQEVIPPRGRTPIQPGDHVFVVMRPAVRARVDRLFSARGGAGEPELIAEMPIAPDSTVGELEEFYGIHLDPDPARTVGELLAERLGDDLTEGAELQAGELKLSVRKMVDGRIREVGVEIFAGDVED